LKLVFIGRLLPNGNSPVEPGVECDHSDFPGLPELRTGFVIGPPAIGCPVPRFGVCGSPKGGNDTRLVQVGFGSKTEVVA